MALGIVLDGTDVSALAFDKKYTRRLNRPATASCRIASDSTGVQPGSSRMKVYENGGLVFHGPVWFVEDVGDEDVAYTTVNAIDPMIYWPMRPARDADGDFSAPTFLVTQQTGPQIMSYILANSETWEGNLFQSIGTVQSGGLPLTGTLLDYPVTIGDVFTILADTGQLDAILSPTEGSDMVSVNLYNGAYGNDLSGGVNFGYAAGAFNVRAVRRSQDMSTVCNKLWYYLGPKVKTAKDPTGAQHWRGNVTGDATGDYNPPGGDVDYSNPLGNLIVASRAAYGVLMDIKIYDDQGKTNDVRPLFTRLWQGEEGARVNPRHLVDITPIRGISRSFDIGDLISVQAGGVLRGGFSGTQRIYEYTMAEDDDGVTQLDNLVTSGDQEGV